MFSALLGWALLIGNAPLVAQNKSVSETAITAETFQVGKDVYVRSLAADPKTNTLWVGTSLGAMQIDLLDRRVKATYTREQGLANEYVFALGIGPTGTVWFGTNAGGVSTLKDAKWKTYFPMHGLADYWVYAFAFEKSGKVWIGTWNGANLFDPTTEHFKTFRDELINIWVYGLDIDDLGRVWFGTEGGVSMFDGTDWKSWTHKDGLGAANVAQLPKSRNTGLGTRSRHDLDVQSGGNPTYNPDYVFAAKVDSKGRGIWFGTWGGGASLFDGQSKWRSYTTADGLAGNIVYSIAQADDGSLWFGTNRGVSYFDGRKWRSFSDNLANPHVYALAIDHKGDIWAGTKGGVTRLEWKK